MKSINGNYVFMKFKYIMSLFGHSKLIPLSFKMKKSVPLPPGPRKAGPQNNGTVPHDSASPLDNSSTSDDGMIDLNVILPGGKSVQMTVESKVPMMDLLIQVTVPNKINPAGHMIRAPTETGNSYIIHKPSTPIGALGTNTIYVVPKNSVIDPPRKIGPKMANQPFEQTFRLQVHLPRNQKTFLRVSPKTLLAEVLNLVCKEKGFEPIHYDVRDPSRPNEPLELGRSLADYKLNEVQLVPSNVPDFRKSTSDLLHAQQVAQSYQPTSKDDSKEKSKKKGIFTFKIPKKKNKSSQDQQGMIGEWSFAPSSSSRCSDSSQPPSLRSVDSSRPALSRPLSTIVTSSNITRPPAHKKRQAPLPPVQKSPSPILTSSPVTKDNPKEEILTTKGQNGTNHSRHSSDSSGYHEASILSDSPENSAGDSLGHVRSPSGLRTSFDDTSLDSMEINNSKMPSPIVNSTINPVLKPPVSDTDSSGNSNTSTLNKKRRAPNPPARPPPPVIKTNLGDITSSEEAMNKSRPVRPPSLPTASITKLEKKEGPSVVMRDKPRPIPRPRSSVDEDMRTSVSPQPRRPCSFVAPPPPPLPDSPSELPSPVDFQTVLRQSSSQTDVATETMDEFKTTCDKESQQKDNKIHEIHDASMTPSELNQDFQEVIAEAEKIIAEEERQKEGQISEMAHFVEKMKSMTTAIEEDTSKQVSTDSDMSKQEGDPSEIDTVIEQDTDKDERKIKVPKRREKRIVEKQHVIKTAEEHETSSEDDNARRNNSTTKKSRKHVPLLNKSISERHELVVKLEEIKSERMSESYAAQQMKDSDSDDSKEVQETLSSLTEKQIIQSPVKKLLPTASPRKLSKNDIVIIEDKLDQENNRQGEKPVESSSLPRPLPRRFDGEKKHSIKQLEDENTIKSEYQTNRKLNEKIDIEKDDQSGIEVLCSVVISDKAVNNKMSQDTLRKEIPDELFNLSLLDRNVKAQKDSKLVERNSSSNVIYLENRSLDNIVNYVTIEDNVQVPNMIQVNEEGTEKVIRIVNRDVDSLSTVQDDKITIHDNRKLSSESPETIINEVERKCHSIENDENRIKKISLPEDSSICIKPDAPTESDQNGEEKKIVLDQNSTEKEPNEATGELIDKKIDIKSDNTASVISEEQKRLQEQYAFFQQQFLMWQQQLLQNQALIKQNQLLPESQIQELEQQLLLQQTLFKQPIITSVNSGSLETAPILMENKKAAAVDQTTKILDPVENRITDAHIQRKGNFQTLRNIESKANSTVKKKTSEMQLDVEKEILTRERNISSEISPDVIEKKIDSSKEYSTYPLDQPNTPPVAESDNHTYPPALVFAKQQEPFQSREKQDQAMPLDNRKSFANSIDESSQMEESKFKEPTKIVYRKWEPPSVKIGAWSERPLDNVPIKTDGTREIKFKPFLVPKSINQFVMPFETVNNDNLLTETTTTVTKTRASSTSSYTTTPVMAPVSSTPIMPPVITTPAVVPISLGPKPFKATWRPTETIPKPVSKPAPVVLGFSQRSGIHSLDSDLRSAYKNYSRSISSPLEVEDKVFKFSDNNDSESKNGDFPETNRVKYAISRFSSFSGSQPSLAPNHTSQSYRSLSPPKIPVKTVSLNSLNKIDVPNNNQKLLKTDATVSRMTKSMQAINTLPSSTSVLPPPPSNLENIVNVEPSDKSVKNFTTVIHVTNEHSSIPSSNISDNPPVAAPPPPSNFFKSSSHTLPSTRTSSSKPRFTMVQTDDGIHSSSSGDVREDLMNAIRNFGGRQKLNKVPVRQASWHFGISN